MPFNKPEFGMLNIAGTFDEFSTVPAMAAQKNTFVAGGEYISIDRPTFSSGDSYSPAIGISYSVVADEIGGALNRFVSPGIYVQGRIDADSTPTSGDAAVAGIASYVVNNQFGDGDAVAGRFQARKTDRAGNLSDTAGMVGEAYQKSTLTGGVMGLEGRIYQNVAGVNSTDLYSSGKWATGLHLISDSTSAPALAGLIVGGVSEVGRRNLWKGMYITGQAFAQNGVGDGVAGTIGVDLSDWGPVYHAEKAIAFGYADGVDSWHMYRNNAAIYSNTSRFAVSNVAGTAGFEAKSTGATNAFLDFYNESTGKLNLFWDATNDEIRMNSLDVDMSFRRSGVEHIRLENGETQLKRAPTAMPAEPGVLWNDGGVARFST